MKKILLLLFVLSLLSCKSKKTKATEAPNEKTMMILMPSEIDAVKKKRAYDLGKRLLETCNTSRYIAYNSSEATEKVRQNATKEKISNICKKMNQRNGRFLGINLIDVMRNKKTEDITFRYAIDYEKKLYKRELNVTINSENKVSAIATKEIVSKPL